MWLLDKSDVLLLNLDWSNKSVGSGIEMEHALYKGIPIIGFGNKPETWYSWEKTSASIIFDSLGEALEYINDNYTDIL